MAEGHRDRPGVRDRPGRRGRGRGPAAADRRGRLNAFRTRLAARTAPALAIAAACFAVATSSPAQASDRAEPREFSLEEYCRRHFLTGLEYARHERYREARESLTLATEACPDDVEGIRQLGAVLLALREPVAAEAAFRRGLALQPEDAGLRSGLAAAHAELAAVDPARADSALHAYLGLVRGGSTDPGAYRTTVDLLLRRGERCEAAALALAALEAPGPANAAPVDGGRGAPLSWEEVGRLCLDLRAYAQAFHLYEEGGPGEGDGLARARILAHFYDRLGWNERAAAAYEEILRRAPEGPAALDETRRLAELLRGADNLVAASERWRQVVAREPGVLRNHYELASVLLDAGRPEEAAEAAERGLAEEPSWLCLWYLRGESIESRGQRREEAGAFDEAIRLYTEARDSFARAAGDPQCGERAARQVERQEALITRARALRDQPAGR